MHFLSCGGELNHHGKYMCDSMFAILGANYKRVTTSEVNLERKNLGYHDLGNDTQYNVSMPNASSEEIRNIVSWCDVMDYGAAPEEYLHEAVKQGKIVFIRIERLLKEGSWKLFVPQVFLRYYRKYIQYRNNKNVYYLCVSAYAADDLQKIGIKNERVLQWAYCPEFKEYSDLSISQENKPLQMLWVGRMISWKHPELAVEIARKLMERGHNFKLRMAGAGEMLEKIKSRITEYGLGDSVEILGAVPADQMRELMRSADVMLATSDQNEGWGVVINEGMNSHCVVVATKEMGAVPVLIEDGVNGFSFASGNADEAVKKIEKLYGNPQLQMSMRNAAYATIKNGFTPKVYADTFVEIAQEALNKTTTKNRYGLGRIIKK